MLISPTKVRNLQEITSRNLQRIFLKAPSVGRESWIEILFENECLMRYGLNVILRNWVCGLQYWWLLSFPVLLFPLYILLFWFFILSGLDEALFIYGLVYSYSLGGSSKTNKLNLSYTPAMSKNIVCNGLLFFASRYVCITSKILSCPLIIVSCVAIQYSP